MADDVLAGALKPPVARFAQTPMPPRAPVSAVDSAEKAVQTAGEDVAKRQAAQTDIEAGQKQLELGQKARSAEKQAELMGESTAAMQPVQEELRDIDMQAAKARFEPSKRNIEENVALFSLINVVGFAIGAGGKNHSQQAMAALNGMSEGVNKGDINRYNQEKATFDTNLNALAKKASLLSNELQRISTLATRNKEEARLQLESLSAREGATFMKDNVEKFGLVRGLALAQQTEKAAQRALERAKEAAERERQMKERLSIEHGYKTEEIDYRAKERQSLKLAPVVKDGAGAQSLVKQFIGVDAGPKDSLSATAAARSVGEALQLKDAVTSNPKLVGRPGQAAGYVQRYVDSFLNGTGPGVGSDEQEIASGLDQGTLVFAKKYAAYLVGYEQSLAGGAKGFTVQFQKRFNALMSSNQFNAEGFKSLMDEQIGDITRRQASILPNVNRKNLGEMGSNIVGRAGEGSSETPAAPSGTPSGSEKQDALPNEVVHADAKGNKAVLRNGVWVEVK